MSPWISSQPSSTSELDYPEAGAIKCGGTRLFFFFFADFYGMLVISGVFWGASGMLLGCANSDGFACKEF